MEALHSSYNGETSRNYYQPYYAIDVANYIVDYCIDKGFPVSNVKLQKLLYYTQAAFLVEKKQKLFRDDIVAFGDGPIIRIVFKNFRTFVHREIDHNCTSRYFNVPDTVEYSSGKIIDDKDKSIINNVLESFREATDDELIRKTHSEEPWKKTAQGSVISDMIMKKYYRRHKDKLRWNKPQAV